MRSVLLFNETMSFNGFASTYEIIPMKKHMKFFKDFTQRYQTINMNTHSFIGMYITSFHGHLNNTNYDFMCFLQFNCLVSFQGSTFPFGPCGHGFMPYSGIATPDNHFKDNVYVTNFEHLLVFLNKVE